MAAVQASDFGGVEPRRCGFASLADVFSYAPDWPLPSAARRDQIEAALASAVAEGLA